MTDRKKTAILYGRVSSTAQAERGLSLPAQFRELRAWAEREGYRVLKEVADTGGKDSKRDVLDRPGINQIQDLVERGGVCVVVAQARDRFGEYPIPDMLAYELARLSKDQTTLRALDSSGEGEDAELGDLFRGWMAKRERRTTARRSRSRKLEIARQGCVIPAHTPTYGYEYTGEKKCRTYRVHEEHMGVVKLIFRMLAVEKMGVHGVARRLNQEGVTSPPTPDKRKHPEKDSGWSRRFIRGAVFSDVYKPHTPEELAALVENGFLAADVAARLEPEKQYCVWWYRGRDYDGEEHRVAVPVPDSGVPREWVDAARTMLKDNAAPSKAGSRECWQLSGGFLFCAGCGRRMQTQAVEGPRDGIAYLYYRCATNQETTRKPCPTNVRLHAERVETATWKFVSELLSSPDQIVAWLERGIEQERRRLRRDPQEDLRQLHERLGAIKRRRGAFQNQQADGLMTLDELRERLADLEEATEAVEQQIEACETRGEGLRSLEEMKQFYLGKGSLWEVIKPLDEWTQISTPEGEWKVRVPFDDQVEHMRNVAHQARLEALAKHTPEQRRERYRELDLRVVAHSKEEIEVSGLFDPERIYISAPSSTSPP